MKPVISEVVRDARAREELRKRLQGLRPGWLCPRCGNAHGPQVESCPEGRGPIKDIIR